MVAPLSVESDLQDSPWCRSCQSEFLGYCLRPWINNVNWSTAAIYIFADSLHFSLWQHPLLLALTGSWSDPRTGLINQDSKIFCWLYCELGLCAPATHLRLAGEMFQDVPVSIHKKKKIEFLPPAVCVLGIVSACTAVCLSEWVCVSDWDQMKRRWEVVRREKLVAAVSMLARPSANIWGQLGRDTTSPGGQVWSEQTPDGCTRPTSRG